MKIENSVIIITGGASGIGESMAITFSKQNAKVYICDIQQNKKLTDNYSIKFIKCDVSNESEVKSMIDQVFTECGRVDIVINNAAIGGGHSPEKNLSDSINNFHSIYKVNMLGVFLVSKYAAQKMIKTHDPDKKCNGVIIMLSSVFGLQGVNPWVSYSGSKGALLGMMMPMARDLGKYKIRVNCICPGYVPTPMVQDLPTKHVVKIVPLKRGAETYEIAQAAESLIVNDYINAAYIKVDGGWISNF